jgi:2-keto-3-deoxy-galactonokinase
MGKSTNHNRDRRGFFSSLISGKEKSQAQNQSNSEKVKMLTADGKLVEIDKSLLDEVAKKQKSTNKEIFDWMKNPSKEQI